jgi:branched-chain amino acid transport system ATP-binding protein
LPDRRALHWPRTERRRGVYEYIQLFVAAGAAILLVEHNVRRVVRMSRYIYVLGLGEITAKGDPEAFAGDLHDQVKSWLGINF